MRLLVLSLAFLSASAAAQDAPVADATSETCTYEICALRVEPGFFGVRIVQGRDGLTVSKSGFLGPNIAEVVASSPEALVHAERAERARTGSFFAILGATVLLSIAVTPEDISDEARVGTLLGGLGLSVYGSALTLTSGREMSRAIWEYNAQIPR